MIGLKSNTFIFVFSGIASLLAIITYLTVSVSSLDSTDFGLLSKLPITYWLGIAVIAILIIYSFRRENSLNILNSAILLVLIVLYVHFLPMAIQVPVSLSNVSFWPSSEANLILSTGHISVGAPRTLMDYSSWPLFIIFTSIMMELTGLSLVFFAKWFPFFILTLWALIVFLIIRKFLKVEYALIGVALFICASWTRQQYFGPPSFAFTLFLLFILLIANRRGYGVGTDQRSFYILAMTTFVAITFSHALTSILCMLIVVASFMASKLFAKKESIMNKSNFIFCLTCCIIQISYLIYISPHFFRYGFQKVMDIANNIGTARALQQVNRLAGSANAQITNYSIALVVLLIIIVSMISFLFILRKRTVPKTQILFWFSTIVILFVIALVPYGTEGPFRAFIFALPLLSLFSIYLLKKKPKIMSLFLIVILLAGIVALWGSESYWLSSNTELAGSEYGAVYLPDNSVLFYKFAPYLRYYNPTSHIRFSVLGQTPFTEFTLENTIQILNASDYIAFSRAQLNFYVYYLGLNPFENIDVAGNPSLITARIYDNGNFTIFQSIGSQYD